MADAGWLALRWTDAGVVLLDQRRLPGEAVYLTLTEVEGVAEAIETLAIRGAPAIGCAAAMGVALAAQRSRARDAEELRRELEASVLPRLAATRPTAVNLTTELERMRSAARRLAAAPGADVDSARAGLIAEAQAIQAEDLASCHAIGRAGAPLIPDGAGVLTHCNTGSLATSGHGTALGVIRSAVALGRSVRVFAGETRPLLQGARLTAWELAQDGIPVKVFTDGMAGDLMARGEVDVVIVGADRIAANGDVANKIGTYGLAVLADAHGIPFYVAAPRTTIDVATPDGASIPIEARGREEVAEFAGQVVVPAGVDVWRHAFDITPARLVRGIVTETGVLHAPYPQAIRESLES